MRRDARCHDDATGVDAAGLEAGVSINSMVDEGVRALTSWRNAAGDIAEAFGYLEPLTGIADHRRSRWGVVNGVVRLMSRARGLRPPLHGAQERHGVSCDGLSAFPTHDLGYLVIVTDALRDDGAVMQRLDALDVVAGWRDAVMSGDDPEAHADDDARVWRWP